MMTVMAIAASVSSPFLGAYASVIAAAWLFALNAPNSAEAVRTGWGFNLYTALVAGGAMGPLAAIGVVCRWPDYSIYCGAISAVILVALIPHFSKMDFWEGPDLLALPLMMAVSLLAWGIRLRSGDWP